MTIGINTLIAIAGGADLKEVATALRVDADETKASLLEEEARRIQETGVKLQIMRYNDQRREARLSREAKERQLAERRREFDLTQDLNERQLEVHRELGRLQVEADRYAAKQAKKAAIIGGVAKVAAAKLGS